MIGEILFLILSVGHYDTYERKVLYMRADKRIVYVSGVEDAQRELWECQIRNVFCQGFLYRRDGDSMVRVPFKALRTTEAK